MLAWQQHAGNCLSKMESESILYLTGNTSEVVRDQLNMYNIKTMGKHWGGGINGMQIYPQYLLSEENLYCVHCNDSGAELFQLQACTLLKASFLGYSCIYFQTFITLFGIFLKNNNGKLLPTCSYTYRCASSSNSNPHSVVMCSVHMLVD